MSDMSHVYGAYAAVHNSEKRKNLKEVRDEISEMNLRQLTDADLYEVAEEVLEELFSNGTDLIESQELVESVFFEKAAEGDSSPVRIEKLERLAEAFDTAFEKVKERSLRTAVESYSEYRRNKERLEKWNDSKSTGSVNHKLHARLVGEDRLVVKNGLKSILDEGALVKAAKGVEKVGGAIAKGARAIDKADKAVTKATMNRVVKPVARAAGRAAKSTAKAAGRAFVGGVKGAVKGALNRESVQSPAAKEEKLRKDDKLFGSPNTYETKKRAEVLGALKKRDLDKKTKEKIAADIVKKKGDTSKSDDRYAYEAYEVTAADKKGNTPAYQAYKAGKKNVKTGEPLYKAAAHLKKEELEATGVFSESEIKKIIWSEFEEGYQRNPEKGEKEDRKYEKVRGERTPMPPRGNKRREDFEKWYAANVR